MALRNERSSESFAFLRARANAGKSDFPKRDITSSRDKTVARNYN